MGRQFNLTCTYVNLDRHTGNYNSVAREVHVHIEGSLMLCFCGAEIYCANLIVLITEHLNRWHHSKSRDLTQQIQAIIS
jgi:hypothetical protein